MKTVISSLLLILLTATVGCAGMSSARHEYLMKGQVIDVTDAGVYLCIGSKDGAQVGDEFKVYTINKAYVNPKTSLAFFRREETGTVKITEIVDEHFARAKVITGKAGLNSVVELSKKL